MIETLISVLKSCRFPVQDEKECQSMIEDVLNKQNISFIREHRLNAKDIPDFFVNGVVVEVKIKGKPIDIYKQCERYCQHPETISLILLTNKTIGFPKELNNKPCYVISMGKSWL